MPQHLSIVGIDLAKRIFHLVGMDDTGHVVLRKRLTRDALMLYRTSGSIGTEMSGRDFMGKRALIMASATPAAYFRGQNI